MSVQSFSRNTSRYFLFQQERVLLRELCRHEVAHGGEDFDLATIIITTTVASATIHLCWHAFTRSSHRGGISSSVQHYSVSAIWTFLRTTMLAQAQINTKEKHNNRSVCFSCAIFMRVYPKDAWSSRDDRSSSSGPLYFSTISFVVEERTNSCYAFYAG